MVLQQFFDVVGNYARLYLGLSFGEVRPGQLIGNVEGVGDFLIAFFLAMVLAVGHVVGGDLFEVHLDGSLIFYGNKPFLVALQFLNGDPARYLLPVTLGSG